MWQMWHSVHKAPDNDNYNKGFIAKAFKKLFIYYYLYRDVESV